MCSGTSPRRRGLEVFKLVVCLWFWKHDKKIWILLSWYVFNRSPWSRKNTRKGEPAEHWLDLSATWPFGAWEGGMCSLPRLPWLGTTAVVAAHQQPRGLPLAYKEPSKPGWFACEFPMGNKASHLANIRPLVKGKLKKQNHSTNTDGLWTVDSKRVSQVSTLGRLEPGMHFLWL